MKEFGFFFILIWLLLIHFIGLAFTVCNLKIGNLLKYEFFYPSMLHFFIPFVYRISLPYHTHRQTIKNGSITFFCQSANCCMTVDIILCWITLFIFISNFGSGMADEKSPKTWRQELLPFFVDWSKKKKRALLSFRISHLQQTTSNAYYIYRDIHTYIYIKTGQATGQK